MQPSTDWREVVEAGEEDRHRQLAADVAHWHGRKNERWGKARFLHRKPLLAVHATLAVAENLPEAARFGVFARPGSLPAIVRLSNGAFDVQANTRPDIRGFAFRVLGITGPAALGGVADHQDFLLINHDVFAARTSAEFMDLVAATARAGEAGALVFLLRRYGWREGLARLKLLLATLSKPFAGYNAERFTTAAPAANGPYAMKMRVTPKTPRARVNRDNGLDMAEQLAAGPLAYEVALQFYTDETSTPIEDPRVAWPVDVSPPVPVATLTLESVAERDAVEALAFDPWGGLAAHRPLGEVMRARRHAYHASQRARLA